MFEGLNSKNRINLRGRGVATAAVVGGLLVSGCGGSAPQKPNRFTKKEAPLANTTSELKAGSTIKGTPLVDFKVGQKNQNVTLKPNPNDGILGIVYSRDFSRSLLSTDNDNNPDHAVGLLLTERSDKVRVSFIFFELGSGEIAHISSSIPVKDANQTLFVGTNPRATIAYEVNIDPINNPDGGVVLSYKSLPVGGLPQTTTSPASGVAA